MEEEAAALYGTADMEQNNDDEERQDSSNSEVMCMCEICSKTFPTKKRLTSHMNQVHSDKIFACSVCGHVCKTKDGVKKHMVQHTGKREFVCAYCGDDFADDGTRKKHEKYMHPTKELQESLQCKECGKQFSYPRNLNLHMRTHSNPFKQTGARTVYPNHVKLEALKLSKEVGSNEASRLLNIPYTNIRNWVDANNAKENKKYYCVICDKNFSANNRLAEHNRLHHSEGEESGAQPRGQRARFTDEFRAEVVAYAAEHTRSETCLYFNLGESTVRNMINRILDPQECDQCGGKFASQAALRRHLKLSHKIDRGYTARRKGENFHDFLETHNIDTTSLQTSRLAKSQQLLEEFEPSKIITCDPNAPPPPREIKPKKKRIRVWKPKPKKKKDDIEENIKDDVTSNDDGEMETNVSADTSAEMINEVLKDVVKEAKVEEVKVEIDINTIKEEELDDSDDENDSKEADDDNYNLENMGDKDLDALMNILHTMKSVKSKSSDDDDEKPDIKAESVSKNVEEDDNDDFAEDFDVDNLHDDSEDDNEETGEESSSKAEYKVKPETGEEAKEKGCLKLKITKVKSKNQKSSTSKGEKKKPSSGKKSKRWQRLPEEQIDYNIDFTSFGINTEDDTFFIKSAFVKDFNFLSVVFSSRYSEKIKRFQCSTCDKAFKTLHDLYRHMNVHSDRRDFSCEFCGDMFKCEEYMKRHIEARHSDQVPLKKKFFGTCQHCGKEFRNRQNFNRHELRHRNGDVTFQCQYCEKSYTQNSSLTFHIKSVHTQDIEKHGCHICGKQFTLKQRLMRHIQGVHSFVGAEVSCEFCGKSFKHKDSLTTHLKQNCPNNGTVKPIKKKLSCHLCNNEYVDKKGLKSHIEIVHEGKINQFECEYCNHKFSRKTSLHAHMKLHTGEYNIFKCDKCSFSSKDKRLLKNHKFKCV